MPSDRLTRQLEDVAADAEALWELFTGDSDEMDVDEAIRVLEESTGADPDAIRRAAEEAGGYPWEHEVIEVESESRPADDDTPE